jgi:NAD(P)H-hydrate epimerase
MPHTVALYDNQSLRSVEAAACSALGSDFALMERAGRAAWLHVLARWPQAQRIVVVCGPGNNGGDGYVLASHALRSGRDLYVARQVEPRTEAARRAQAAFVAAGGRCVDFSGT